MSPLQLIKEEIKQLKAIHKYTHNNSMRENRIRVVLLCDKNMSKKEISQEQEEKLKKFCVKFHHVIPFHSKQ